MKVQIQKMTTLILHECAIMKDNISIDRVTYGFPISNILDGSQIIMFKYLLGSPKELKQIISPMILKMPRKILSSSVCKKKKEIKNLPNQYINLYNV